MLEHYQKAFKAYDIRGAYGKNIDERFSYTMGKAIGKYLGNNDLKLLIGCDVRVENPSLISHFVAGLQKSGFTNISYAAFDKDEKNPYGICSTPVLYYLGQGDFDLSVAFTASHNLPGDVGMKFFDKDVTLLSTESLREMFEKEYSEQEKLPSISDSVVLEPEFFYEKQEKLFAFLESKWSQLKKKHTFAVDFSNGAAVSIERDFFKNILQGRLAHQIFMLNYTPDGLFQSHHSDTQEYHNYQQLIENIKSTGAGPANPLKTDQAGGVQFGVMFDGDADRIGIVGPDGLVLGGDLLTAMIAKQILLESNEGRGTRGEYNSIVLYETMSSKMVNEVVTHFGGEARMTRVGRYFINQKLKACNGIFAGESSGHYLFAEMGGYEMPLLALYYICKEMEEYSSWAEFVGTYKKYFKSPVISLVVSDKEAALKKVQEKYAEFEIKFVDGVSVYAPDFWFNLRPSNTEDKIKFTVEADTEEKMTQVVEELRGML